MFPFHGMADRPIYNSCCCSLQKYSWLLQKYSSSYNRKNMHMVGKDGKAQMLFIYVIIVFFASLKLKFFFK